MYVRAILVEADPTHVAYIRDAIQAAGVSLAQVQVIDAAIGGRDGVGEMTVGNAEAWWGQVLSSFRQLFSPEGFVVDSAAEANTHQQTRTPRDPETVYLRTVPVVSLQTLLAGEEVVDLVHFDCQGQELPVLKEALQVGGVLDKVKALHIGTHSPAIEAQIFGMLCKARWHLVALHLQASSDLMFRFRSRQFNGGDGIQVCLNPPRVHH